jgi:hypothetical protein
LSRITVVRSYLVALGVFGLFWWPLSHWLYPDAYHDLLGFQGAVDGDLVKVIGTLGTVPILGLFLVARDPLRNRDFLAALLVFYALMAATYVYLINASGFPGREYVNVALLLVNGVALALLYPWSAAGPGFRSSASGAPSASAAPAGGQEPNQLSRAPSIVSTEPEKKSPAGEAR